MRIHPVLFTAPFMALALAGCGGETLEHTQWEADMSSVQWGEAGNSVVRDRDYWRVNLGPDGEYRETCAMGGRVERPTGTYEVTSHDGDEWAVHVTISPVEAFDLRITGHTMSYSRGAAVGQINATMSCSGMCPH